MGCSSYGLAARAPSLRSAYSGHAQPLVLCSMIVRENHAHNDFKDLR
jgi:hypothetical protein